MRNPETIAEHCRVYLALYQEPDVDSKKITADAIAALHKITKPAPAAEPVTLGVHVSDAASAREKLGG